MIKNILIDIDGVLWDGGLPIQGAKEAIDFLEEKGYNFLFLTNISRLTRAGLSKKLHEAGLKVQREKIMSPVEATIDFVKSKKPNAVCYLIAEPQIKQQFKEVGLTVSSGAGKIDFVVVFLYEKTNYDMLDTAFRALNDGAKLVASSDLKHVAFRDKKQSIATGVFVKGLEYCSGKKAFLTGKPNKLFFTNALKKLKAKKSQTLMVGDNISTDIVGAKTAGIKSVLVKTGNFTSRELEKSVIKPDAVIGSVAYLPEFLEKVPAGFAAAVEK